MCHKNGLLWAAALMALIFTLPIHAQAAEYRIGNLTVAEPRSRPTPPTATVGVVYFSLFNAGAAADRLVALDTPVARTVEIHESRTVQGIMQMRPVTSVECPPGATVKIEPGGLHVMLVGLIHPLTAGMEFPLSLKFRDAGTLTVQVRVGGAE